MVAPTPAFPLAAELSNALHDLGASAAGAALVKACANHYAEHPAVVDTLAKEFLTVLRSVNTKPALLGAAVSKDVKPQVPSPSTGPPVVDLSTARTKMEACSVLAPRGKFTLAVLPGQAEGKADVLALVSAAATGATLQFSASTVERVLVLEKPKDSQQTVYIMLVLRSDSPLTHGKQKLSNVLFQTKGNVEVDIEHPDGSGARMQGAAPSVLCQLFGYVTQKQPETSQQKYFCGSQGNIALTATLKVNPGVIFPLKSGITFVERPALFMPAKQMTKITLGRVAGTSTTFDLSIDLQDGSTHEFGMLLREELPSLQEYLARIQKFMPKGSDNMERGEESEEGDQGGVDNNGVNSSDSSDEDDGDFDPDASDSSGDEGPNQDGEEDEQGSDDEEQDGNGDDGSDNGSEESDASDIGSDASQDADASDASDYEMVPAVDLDATQSCKRQRV